MGRERLSRALDRPKFDYGSQSAVATGLNDGLASLYGMTLECGDSAPLLTGRLDAPPSFPKSGVRQGLFLRGCAPARREYEAALQHFPFAAARKALQTADHDFASVFTTKTLRHKVLTKK